MTDFVVPVNPAIFDPLLTGPMNIDGRNIVKYLPDEIDTLYNSIMGYLKINTAHVVPEAMFKTGPRDKSIVFKYPDRDNLVGRIIVNLGPDDNFTLDTVDPSSGRVVDRKEITLIQKAGIFLPEPEYSGRNIVLHKETKRKLLRWVNGKQIYQASLRKKDHRSVIAVICLFINEESALLNQTVGPANTDMGNMGSELAKFDPIGNIERI